MSIVIAFVIGAVGGWVGSYLVFRNNAKLKAKVDAEVNKIESKLK